MMKPEVFMKKTIRSMRPLLLAALFFAALGAYGQQKYALVIGNAAYTSIGKLKNPVNDANDMAATLRGLGFQVDLVVDGNLGQMEDAALRLRNRLSTGGNTYGFFFYAGHGVQSNGENYLIPVDADIRSESLLRQRTMAVSFLMSELNDAGNALNLVVLDACRDNPFSWARTGSRGLQVMGNQPVDSIIVYASSAGSTALDGEGRNGLFTSHLLNNLKIPGLEINEVFRMTMGDVARASNNAQRPAIYSQFAGLAYLGSSSTAPVVIALEAPRNFHAGTPGTKSVRLDWDSAGSGVSYRIYYNTWNNPSSAEPLDNLTTELSMNIIGMASETNYYFWVSSVKEGQESEKSSVVSVQTIGEFDLELGEKGLTIRKYKGEAASVNIPAAIDGIPVVAIGDSAFSWHYSLASITIPPSVTVIGERAFAYCRGLTSVSIPNSVTAIGERAFEGCRGLTSVSIPNSVTAIGSWAFENCSELSSITVGAMNTRYSSSKGILFSKDGKTLVRYPAGKMYTSYNIPSSVTAIGEGAFEDCCSLSSIIIPNSVTAIGEWAFAGCRGLIDITIPNGVTEIKYRSFYG
jgi:hypothetical protein